MGKKVDGKAPHPQTTQCPAECKNQYQFLLKKKPQTANLVICMYIWLEASEKISPKAWLKPAKNFSNHKKNINKQNSVLSEADTSNESAN